MSSGRCSSSPALRRHAHGAGANSVAFSGRVGHRALKRGAHALSLVATDAAGNASKRSTLALKIVKP